MQLLSMSLKLAAELVTGSCSSACLHAVLRALKAPVIAGTLHGKDVLMVHLSDVVIYQGSQSPANYPVLVVCCRGSARCTPSFKKTKQNKSVAVIKGLCCCDAVAVIVTVVVVCDQQLLKQTEEKPSFELQRA